MLVKICGIQTPGMAQVAVEAGADFIGLVFAESKRQVNLEQAKEIKNSLSDTTVKVVGVFRDMSITQVNEISQRIGLDYVQLHGEESVTECRQIKAPLIKALSFEEISEARHYRQVADYILIDSPKPGSGETFDWTTLTHENEGFPYFLAGGLSPENIEEAIQHLQPIGVDVSSGVETNRSKDAEKIRRFTHQAKQIGKR